ncbi:MAG: metalloregulator ArsR/SmtB family transcription factor [Acidimicrobiia bacterium]|nr:metalloregulator ArsR/SmtB family transcription factor [Acidimicrobiia bacterium]
MTQIYKSETVGCCDELSVVVQPELFKALSDPNRLVLLTTLSERAEPSTVSEAAECCSVDMSVVSRHLTMMRNAGLVTAEKRGRQVFYSVPRLKLATQLRAMADALESCCSNEEESQDD